jgi:hypothetical protein
MGDSDEQAVEKSGTADSNNDKKYELNIDDDTEIEVLLTHYEQIREEIRMINNETNSRTTQGLAAIAIIVGSIFVQERAILLLTLIPMIIWFLYVRSVAASVWIVQMQTHIIHIQKQVNISTFDWEQEYSTIASDDTSFSSIPKLVSDVSFIFIYIISSVIGTEAVGEIDITTIYNIKISPSTVAVFYIFLGIIAGISEFSYQKVLKAERQKAGIGKQCVEEETN